MILSLQPTQIATFWQAIKETIMKSSPLSSEEKIDVYLNHTLASLLSGKHQCWLVYDEVDEGKMINGILVTSLMENLLFGYTSLSIDHMYAFTKWNSKIVTDIFDALVAYANECECIEIIADSNNVKAIDIAVSFGATKETTKLCYKI